MIIYLINIIILIIHILIRIMAKLHNFGSEFIIYKSQFFYIN